VDSKKSLAQEEDSITLKNHMWHGARPNFTTIDRMINTLTLILRNRSASTEEKKNHNDATAWVKKYFTLFSN